MLNNIKPAVSRAIIALRRTTSRYRQLPNVFIVGAQKCGTTSLAAYLAQHSEIASPFFKEVHYFDDGPTPTRNNFQKGTDWYKANFPVATPNSRISAVFDATPMYLFHPLAAARIFALVPDARIITLLRNPVDRAISHFHHSTNHGHETLSMLEAMQAEDERISTAMINQDFSNFDVRRFSYKARGLYAEQIQRYLQLFPRENMLFVSSDALFQQTQSTLHQIFEFVGVNAAIEIPDIQARNVSLQAPNVPQAVRDYLDDFFRQPNLALYDLLDRDFGW